MSRGRRGCLPWVDGMGHSEIMAISEFPKGRKYLISLSFRGKASVRPAQVGGFDVNIVIHGSTAVRGRGDLVAYRWALWKLTAPWTHRTHPPHLGKRAISEFPKGRKYLISLSFRGKASVRPAQVGGFDVNIVIHGSTAVRRRGDLVAYRWALWKLTAPWTHRTRPPHLGKRCAFSTSSTGPFPSNHSRKTPKGPKIALGNPDRPKNHGWCGVWPWVGSYRAAAATEASGVGGPTGTMSGAGPPSEFEACSSSRCGTVAFTARVLASTLVPDAGPRRLGRRSFPRQGRLCRARVAREPPRLTARRRG